MIIGNIIKYHRIAKKLTQNELCAGICSITHLSKIENNNKEADPETISLLLNRLGLSLTNLSQFNSLMKGKLNKFLRFIIFYDKASASEMCSELQAEEDQIVMSEYVYIYHLYLYRYYLLMGDLKNAQEKKSILEQLSYAFSQHESHLLKYFNAILLIQQGNFGDALERLHSFEEDGSLPYSFQGEFYYQIALTYSNLKDSSSCVSYAQKAIKEFSNQFNYIRILHAQILLGIHYTELGLYHEANEQYSHLLRNVNVINGNDLYSTIHHNFALLCEKQEEYEKACVHYRIAQEHAVNSNQYYMSLCNLTEILILEGKSVEALENIALILENTKTKAMKKYYLIFKYYEFLLLEKTNVAFSYLENHVLPYLEKKNLTVEMEKYAQLIADYFSEIDKDKAIYYYKKVQKAGV